MNIFILDNDHQKNAEYHIDKHVSKMITEHAQIMSTVVRLSGIDSGYKKTHVHHPCVKWAGESLSNWLYMLNLTKELHKEWKIRYNHPKERIHKSYGVMLELPRPNIKDIGLTPFAQAMPDEYKSNDAVESYRNYYINEKRNIASWKNRNSPYWWE